MTLITGAKGILGSSLPQRKDFLRTDRKELNLTDYKAVKEFLKEYRPSAILHLASLLPACQDSDLMYEVNVNATANLVKLAKEYGVEKFVFTSSCAVYEQKELEPTKENENISPRGVYGATKYLAEQEILKVFPNAVIFRIFNIYGGGFMHSLINKLLGGDKVYLYDPDKYFRDYVYYSDVVKLLMEALDCDREGVYNLSSGVVRSSLEVVNILEGWGAELDYSIAQKYDGSVSWGDIEKLKTDFLHKPKEGLVWENGNSILTFE